MEQDQKTDQGAGGGAVSTKARFPLLRRLSVTSLVAMLVTVTILVVMYRQDQFAEHEEIAEQENERTAIHLTHQWDDQIAALISAADKLDIRALRTNPNISAFTADIESAYEHHVLKIKLFNLSGTAVYSPIKEEIGTASKHPDWLAKSIRGETVHHMEFRNSFTGTTGELHDRYIAITYMPLTHAGKRIGVIEIYSDATPIIQRIFSKTVPIILTVLGAFAALYAALFFAVFRTDRAVAEWQKTIAGNAEKLAASEQQFHTLAEAMPQIVWIARPDGWVTYINRRWMDYTGLTLEESCGHGWNKPFHPDDRQHAWGAWQHATRTDSEYALECRLRRTDGVYRWWLIRGVSLHDAGGKVINWFGTCTDIEDMKRAELRDKALVRRNQVLMQSTSEGIHILDERGNVIEANDAFCRHLGYAQAEILQLSVFDFEAKLAVGELRANLEKLRDGHAVFESVHRRKDGALVDVEVNVSGVELDGQKCFYALSRDITGRKRTELALRESEAKFKSFFEYSQVGMNILDPDYNYISVNKAFCEMTGYFENELLSHNFKVITHPDDIEANLVLSRKLLANEIRYFHMEKRYIRKDGGIVHAALTVSAVRDEGEKLKYVVATILDITERKQAEIALRESEERLYATIETSMDAVVQMDADGIITGWNSQMEAVFGWRRADALDRPLHEIIIPPQQREAHMRGLKHFLRTGEGPILNRRIEVTGLHHDGHEFPVELTVAPIKMGDKYEFSAFLRDITKKKETEAIIWRQANFDPLTGLPNRHMFHDRMEQEIRKARRAGRPIALMFIDLDRFKEVNDTLGHDMGDLLLVEAAHRIADCVRATDIVARLGGDEFTVLLAELDDVGSVERIATSITHKLAAPFRLKSEVSYVSASIGITLYPSDADTIEGLFKNADQAMYVAKNQGRNRHSYFTRAMQETAQMRMRLTNDLRSAMACGQFAVYFQPIVELATGRINKAEALIRWQHPERGLVSPAEFIPLAEETGLIFEIGDWVFHESMRWAKHWRARFNPLLQISVNKSPVQFYKDGDDHSAWLSHLQELDLPGQGLAIEITEGLLIDSNASITGALLTFRDTGIQVSIDDFGTGYSSLAYLNKFDIDYLKIDQSFTRGLSPESSDRALSEAIIVMAHKLGLKVIAEGVETKEQRDLLVAAGCDYAQGYLYSRPVPPDDFEVLLKNGLS